ncbi:MAG: carboxypeptidase M32 [Paracoccaceae bacterium]
MTAQDTALAGLLAFQRETALLGQVAERLGWDQETVMPRGAAAQRGEETAAMEAVLHARRTDPRIGDWLAAAKPATPAEARAVELIGQSLRRSACVPLRLATEIARMASVGQGIWAEARATENVAHFLPSLREILALKREEGAALAAGGIAGDTYDALLDGHEPGATAATVGAMFARMRPRLVALRERVLGATDAPAPLAFRFPEAGQMAVAREVADAFGYDWSRGRLDLAVHPFSSGSGQDVRITTRVVETDPFNCLYATAHEVGHACYELAIDAAHFMTPLGRGVSMGVHESQSRIYENQIGRSRAFTGWLFNRMRARFGDFGIGGAAAFYRTVNRVRPGFIRTEADEVHYNLHIMMRFDLERALIAGELDVVDLEGAWNERFHKDFGQRVDRPSHGMLQDVHWSVGAFGYFPTYTLGNVYAGCLFRALCAGVGDLDAHLAEGNARPATDWLREGVQRHGGLYKPAEAIARATGAEPDEGPLLDYLEAKFGEIYRV